MEGGAVSDDTNLKLLARIGNGGMSSVWKAWDPVNRRLVAVKVLNREFSGNENDIVQFREEEKMMEEIRHPGIVQAYSLAKCDGYWYFVMEYVDGYSFAELLQRKQHISESDCLLICEAVSAALGYAWNSHGVVHCDIKPENIMINTAGEIKLTDLGISHRFEFREGPQEVPEHILGTPAYISPEQVYGDIELDCRADIYSLGATIYHLCTGRVLFPMLDNDGMMRAQCSDSFQARDPRTYRPHLSEGFCQLLESMLVKDRDYRVASWDDVCAMCQMVEQGVKFKPREDAATRFSSLRLLG